MPPRVSLKRLLRFSIATLLFLMLCVAGYFGGYRRGFDSGKEERRAITVTIRTYPVADLISPQDPAAAPNDANKVKAFDQLIDLIVSTVDRDTWMENGTGQGEIQPFPSNNSLVISQTNRVHEQVALLLEELRKLRTNVDVKETIPLLQSLAATERQQSVTLRKFADSKQSGGSAELLFDSAVANIADRWGAPDFRGAATDRDFPSWSVAQQVATWPRGEGVAYIAVQDDAQEGRVIQAGWHAEQ
jgi:hypothetical protein